MDNPGYLYETHMHTCPVSACAVSTGREMAERLAAEGYAGCIVTDHFFNGNCSIRREFRWEDRVRLFTAGYRDCYETGKRLGLDVWFGFEFNRHAIEFLVLGLTPQWLYDHPDCDRLEVPEFAELVHRDNGVLVHAHPFRVRPYIPRVLLYPECVDGVEVYNYGNRNPPGSRADEKAAEYAAQFGKFVTAGTDVHWTGGIVGAGLRFDHRLTGMEDMIACLRAGQCQVQKAAR